jgi:tetratricopeptide (TPR) repeat protein
MKNVHAILVLLVVLLPFQGQASTKVDSLKQLLLHSEVPIDRAEVLWSIAYELFDVDNEQAVFYAERAYHDVWQRGDSLQIVKVGTTYGQLLRRVGKLRQSIEISEGLLQIARRHDFKKYTSMLLNSLTLCLILTEEFGEALEFGYELLEHRRVSGKQFDIGIALNNLGLLFYKMGDHKNAIEFYLEAVSILRNIKDTTFLPGNLYNLGLAYSQLNQLSTAINYIDSAVALKIPSRDAQMHFSFAYAEVYRKLLEFNTAERHYLRCLELADNLKDSRFQMTALNALANLELRRGNLSLCEKYLAREAKVVGAAEHKQLRIERLKTEAEYHAAKGEMTIAYQETQKYILEKFSMIYEMNRDVRNAQQRAIQKDNVRKLKMQANILDLQNLTLERQRIFAGSVTLLLFILAFLTYKLLNANSQIRSINRLLDARVVERTGELRKHSDLVHHLVDEHRISGNRFASELFSLVGTLKGLLNLCNAESGSNSQQCLSKASVVVAEIEGIVTRLRSEPTGNG